mmetsp:Transcript_91806/g.262864  ORF Transcript_91806/g.262864 Transcript_91806/m.262864 type:complete len:273 (+) Transcript_91806:956-1774(+)
MEQSATLELAQLRQVLFQFLGLLLRVLDLNSLLDPEHGPCPSAGHDCALHAARRLQKAVKLGGGLRILLEQGLDLQQCSLDLGEGHLRLLLELLRCLVRVYLQGQLPVVHLGRLGIHRIARTKTQRREGVWCSVQNPLNLRGIVLGEGRPPRPQRPPHAQLRQHRRLSRNGHGDNLATSSIQPDSIYPILSHHMLSSNDARGARRGLQQCPDGAHCGDGQAVAQDNGNAKACSVVASRGRLHDLRIEFLDDRGDQLLHHGSTPILQSAAQLR